MMAGGDRLRCPRIPRSNYRTGLSAQRKPRPCADDARQCTPFHWLQVGKAGEELQRKSQGQNRVGEIPPLGIVGGLTEPRTMEKAKRARKAETLKQPSLPLRLRDAVPLSRPHGFSRHGIATSAM